MNSYIDNGAELIRKQYQENERQTNKAVTLIFLGYIAICLVTDILMRYDDAYEIAQAAIGFFMPICAVNAVCCVIAWKNNFEGAWIKYMLMSGVIILSVGTFFVFTTYMSYFTLVPLFISTRYFNKRFIYQVSVTTLLLFLLACVLNIVLEPVSETVRDMHAVAGYNAWTSPRDAAICVINPMLLIILFVMMFSLNTSNKGRLLLQSQGESARKIAAVETELKMASDIQRSALPDKSYICPDGHFRVEAEEVPAKVVGGDFYDYFMAGEHTMAVLIADVSDKGAPAAMFMMSAKKAIQCAVQCCDTLKDAVELANRLICSDNKSGMFLTLWLGIIDTRSGMGKYINAGHIPPTVRHADGSVSVLQNEPDLFIGNFPNMPPKVNDFRMNKGDVLLLSTDGLTDAMNTAGEFFGADRAFSAFEKSGADAEKAVSGLLRAVRDFSGEQEPFDDITLLALECIDLEKTESAVIDTRADREGTARIIDGVNDLLIKLACPEEERRNIGVVTDELCANISDYAYDGQNGPMRVEAEAGANFVTLKFVDSGLAFDPLEQADPDFPDEPMMGGLGIFFVKNLVDEMRYQRIEDQNMLTVTRIWNI